MGQREAHSLLQLPIHERKIRRKKLIVPINTDYKTGKEAGEDISDEINYLDILQEVLLSSRVSCW